jgi:hypothetical protein
MKTRILFLLNCELSKAEVIEVMRLSALYHRNGLISDFEHLVIFRRCVTKLK